MGVELADDDDAIDDPEIYDGAHVGVQLVGRRLEEEKMIALAKYVGEALKAMEAEEEGKA